MNKQHCVDIKVLRVDTMLNCNGVIVKLFEVPFNCSCNQNIIAENEFGELIWQIEDINPLADWPFLKIRSYDQEKIIAHNWIGVDYYIEILTGKLEIVNKDSRPW